MCHNNYAAYFTLHISRFICISHAPFDLYTEYFKKTLHESIVLAVSKQIKYDNYE